MIHGLIVALLTYACIWIYRRFFAKMISEEEWVGQLTAYHDEDTYTLEERQKAEQFLIYHEGLLKARGIRYINNEEFLAQKKQRQIRAQTTASELQTARPVVMKIEQPGRTDNARLPPPLPKRAASVIGPITIAQHNQTYGPYDVAAVLALWDQGQLAGNALYWHGQLSEWKPLASDIETLRTMLG